MKTTSFVLSLAASAYSFAETTIFDFESAVEEFTEITIDTTSVDFADPTAAFSSVQAASTAMALMSAKITL